MAEKLYYSMGEVAEMLCVSTSLVRFWEKRFDILKPQKNRKGNRLFTPADVRNLKTIYHLVKEKGMTLAGAEKQLKARRSAIERDMEIAERLGAIRALLVEVRNELGGGGIVVDRAVVEEEPPREGNRPSREEAEPEQNFVEQTLF
jgi:DNA-binding transcriptional MerR regulator